MCLCRVCLPLPVIPPRLTRSCGHPFLRSALTESIEIVEEQVCIRVFFFQVVDYLLLLIHTYADALTGFRVLLGPCERKVVAVVIGDYLILLLLHSARLREMLCWRSKPSRGGGCSDVLATAHQHPRSVL